MNLARFSAVCGIENSTFLNFRCLARHADDDPGMDQALAAMSLMNEIVEHTLSHLEIGNDAVAERTNGNDIRRRAAEHVLGFGAAADDLSRASVHGNDGGFVEHNALPGDINQGIRGT